LTGPNETEVTDLTKPITDKVPNASGKFLLVKGRRAWSA